MILDPQGVLRELVKYQKIVDYSKMAFERLAKGQPVDDLRDILKVKLNECEFTQVTGLGTVTTPLHSVTAYIDKSDMLEQQISNAENFVTAIVEKIKTDVGPFYSKSEVMSFKENEEIVLDNHVWMPTMEPIRVKKYTDSKSGITTQVDWTHGQYRTAKDGQTFGPWKFFVK